MGKQPGKLDASDGDLGNRIARLRRERHLSQAELARRAGLSYRTVHDIEAGRRQSSPLETTLLLIAEALGISYEELLGEEEAKGPGTSREGGRREGPAAGRGPATWLRRPAPLVAVLAVLAVATVTAILLTAHDGPGAISWEITNGTILARDGRDGRILWSHTHDSPVRCAAACPWSDVPLLAYGLGSLASDGGSVFVRDLASGALIWEMRIDPRDLAAIFRPEILERAGFDCREILFADLEGDGQPELVTNHMHGFFYPALISVLGRDGRLRGRYANFGHLYQILVEDLDGDRKDEILVAGTSNLEAYQGATVFILDEEHCTGGAADSLSTPGLAVADSSLVRVVFPSFAPEIMALLNAPRIETFTLQTFRGLEDELRISCSMGTHEAQVIVTLDDALRPLGVVMADDFLMKLRAAAPPEPIVSEVGSFQDYLDRWLDGYHRYEVGARAR